MNEIEKRQRKQTIIALSITVITIIVGILISYLIYDVVMIQK